MTGMVTGTIPGTASDAVTDGPTVLIAEDDKFDQLIFRRAFRAARLSASVRFVEHGEKLIGYLDACGQAGGQAGGRGESREAGRPRPALVFLDLNMPVLDGRAALRRLRAEPGWRDLPVVAMSTLTDVDEIAEVLALGANRYFTKPVRFEELVDTIRSCVASWLPPGGAADGVRH